MDEFVKMLLQRGCVESLRALDIQLSSDPLAVEVVGTIIRKAGAHLTDLRLICTNGLDFTLRNRPYTIALTDIDFATNTRLQSITLESITHPATFPLLSRIISPHLQTVKFESYVHNADEEASSYALLEQTMLSPNLVGVSEVQFEVDGNNEVRREKLERYAQGLPELNRMGVLRVVPKRQV